MASVFDEKGDFVPVTVIEAGPMFLTQIKTEESDGYVGLQFGFEDQKAHRINKPLTGQFKKANVSPKKYVRELSQDNAEALNLGDSVNCGIFEGVTLIDVTGTSKGKGTQGPIKRWGFSRGPESHGSKYHRGPGSSGASSTPSRVMPGKKMAGRMGNERVTVQNLELVKVDVERNLLLVKGAVPGPKGGLVIVQEAIKSIK